MAENNLLENWPKTPDGTPEAPALLCTESDYPDLIYGISTFLESFGIPHYIKRRGSGEYMNFYFGHSATDGGVEVYVPASRLEEAKELLNAPPVFEDEMMEEEPEE